MRKEMEESLMQVCPLRVLGTCACVMPVASLPQELRADVAASRDMVGRAPAMDALRQVISETAPTTARVLITGEHGTGIVPEPGTALLLALGLAGLAARRS